MSRDWNTYIYRCPTKRCASYITKNKYYNLDPEEKRVCIPRIIWNDGHGEWSRWYWFKDKCEHVMRGCYVGFVR